MRFLPGWIVSLALVTALLTSEAGAADRCGDVDLSKLTSRIYVSPKGTDSDSCGANASSPCGSIQRGIDRCGAKSCGVLVRYGLYSLTEPIRLRQGVNVYGRCVFDGDSDRKYRSVIEAPPDGKPGITADKIFLGTVLDGVFVRGSDATSPGGASIAMTVSNSIVRNSGPLGLTIAHSILSSGKGANGAPGQTSPGNSGGGGAPGWQQAGPGGAGGPACPSSSNPQEPGRGGVGGPGTWNNSKGCFAYCACSANNNPSGQAGQESGQAKGGDGGPGGGPGKGCRADNKGPEDGFQGRPGNPGSCGKVGGTTTADIWGTFSGTDWHPDLGGSGNAGYTGSGGGGGGGGGACAYMDRDFHWHDVNGMPGGGAGGGGCGGPGGQGGQQGGASFPIVIYSSTLTASLFTRVTLVPGPGGQGGAGAIGGQGGPGGPGGGGAGGHFDDFQCPGSGGPGGAGGQGGAGSGGAGGNGGPSVGVALVSTTNTHELGSVSIYGWHAATGGPGGAGGQNDPKQCQGEKGAGGLAGGGDYAHYW